MEWHFGKIPFEIIIKNVLLYWEAMYCYIWRFGKNKARCADTDKELDDRESSDNIFGRHIKDFSI